MAVVAVLWIWGPVSTLDETGREYVADRGKRIHIVLDDGTSVVLNAESRLTLSADFGHHNRSLHLDGEAYFDVSHDDARPFVIDAGGAEVQVLGTAFGVRSYEDDNDIRVVVREGRVAFRSAGHGSDGSIEVGASETASMLPSGEITLRRNVDVMQYLGWVEGNLVFVDRPLEDVASELERWYDIQVDITDHQIRQLPLTATFEGQAAFHVIDVIARTLELQYDIAGRHVSISARNP